MSTSLSWKCSPLISPASLISHFASSHSVQSRFVYSVRVGSGDEEDDDDRAILRWQTALTLGR